MLAQLLASLQSLQSTFLSCAGTLPTAWANLSNLTFLDLDSNRLTGKQHLQPAGCQHTGSQQECKAFMKCSEATC